MSQAVLVLADGTMFTGESLGLEGKTLGEVVFCTAMTGYQETLTDPSYKDQIVISTAAQVGNTGWNEEDNESLAANLDHEKIWVAGYAVKNYSNRVSSWRATSSLEEKLIEQKIVGIKGIDTRAVVRHIRDSGSINGGIFSGKEVTTKAAMLEQIKAAPSMSGLDLSAEVSTKNPYILTPPDGVKYRIAAIDLGMKTNIARMLLARGVEINILPYDATLADLKELNLSGLFMSNGPGDPATANKLVDLTKAVIAEGLPFFGICFGNQIFGRALGKETYKMKFGHRGINLPVQEADSGKVTITSHNHGFALAGEKDEIFSTEFGKAKVTHICANDGTVEGVRLEDKPAFSVQYHPEAAAGPHDAAYLFDKFIAMLEGEEV